MSTQTTTSSSQKSNLIEALAPLWELLNIIGMIAVLVLVIVVSLEFTFVTAALLILATVFVMFSNAYITRLHGIQARDEAAKHVEMQQSAGLTPDPEEMKVAESEIPPYEVVLKRYTLLIGLFVFAFVVLTTLLLQLPTLYAALSIVFDFSEDFYDIGLMLMILVGGIVWMLASVQLWNAVTKLVDTRILKTTLDIPKDKETRNKQERQKMFEEAEPTPLLERVKRWGVMLLVIAGLAAIEPLSRFIGSLVYDVGASEDVAVLVQLGLAMGTFAVVGILFFRYQQRTFANLTQSYEDELREALVNAETPESAQEIQQALDELEAQKQIEEHSTTSKVSRNMMRYVYVGLFLVIVVAGLITVLARFAGATPNQAEGILVIALLVGIVLFFVLMGKLNFVSEDTNLFGDAEPLLKQGRYDEALAIMDAAMAKLPNWETGIMGAVSYLEAGRLDRAEAISQEVLKELTEGATSGDMFSEMYKNMISAPYTFLMESAMARGDMQKAAHYYTQLHKHPIEETFPYNSSAKYMLYQGKADEANAHLDKAAALYRKEKTPPAGFHLALRAWAMALQGDRSAADALMLQAFETVSPEEIALRAELYMLGGYVARAENKHLAAQLSFEKAIKTDPNGLYALIAQREVAP